VIPNFSMAAALAAISSGALERAEELAALRIR
jgi:hypothetical protein